MLDTNIQNLKIFVCSKTWVSKEGLRLWSEFTFFLVLTKSPYNRGALLHFANTVMGEDRFGNLHTQTWVHITAPIVCPDDLHSHSLVTADPKC